MRGVVGLTLVGGGIVLIVGLFTGKIVIPFAPAPPTTASDTRAKLTKPKPDYTAKDAPYVHPAKGPF